MSPSIGGMRGVVVLFDTADDTPLEKVLAYRLESQGTTWAARRPLLCRLLAMTEEILGALAKRPELYAGELYDAIPWRKDDPADQMARLELMFTALGLLDGEGLVLQRLGVGGAGTCVVLTEAGQALLEADSRWCRNRERTGAQGEQQCPHAPRQGEQQCPYAPRR